MSLTVQDRHSIILIDRSNGRKGEGKIMPTTNYKTIVNSYDVLNIAVNRAIKVLEMKGFVDRATISDNVPDYVAGVYTNLDFVVVDNPSLSYRLAGGLVGVLTTRELIDRFESDRDFRGYLVRTACAVIWEDLRESKLRNRDRKIDPKAITQSGIPKTLDEYTQTMRDCHTADTIADYREIYQTINDIDTDGTLRIYVELLVQGKNCTEIADILGHSVRMVQYRVKALREYLTVKGYRPHTVKKSAK